MQDSPSLVTKLSPLMRVSNFSTTTKTAISKPTRSLKSSASITLSSVTSIDSSRFSTLTTMGLLRLQSGPLVSNQGDLALVPTQHTICQLSNAICSSAPGWSSLPLYSASSFRPMLSSTRRLTNFSLTVNVYSPTWIKTIWATSQSTDSRTGSAKTAASISPTKTCLLWSSASTTCKTIESAGKTSSRLFLCMMKLTKKRPRIKRRKRQKKRKTKSPKFKKTLRPSKFRPSSKNISNESGKIKKFDAVNLRHPLPLRLYQSFKRE